MKRRLFLLGGFLSSAALALGIRRTQTVREWMAEQGITLEVRNASLVGHDWVYRELTLTMKDRVGVRTFIADTDEAESEALSKLRGTTVGFHKYSAKEIGASDPWQNIAFTTDTISITFPKDLA